MTWAVLDLLHPPSLITLKRKRSTFKMHYCPPCKYIVLSAFCECYFAKNARKCEKSAQFLKHNLAHFILCIFNWHIFLFFLGKKCSKKLTVILDDQHLKENSSNNYWKTKNVKVGNTDQGTKRLYCQKFQLRILPLRKHVKFHSILCIVSIPHFWSLK